MAINVTPPGDRVLVQPFDENEVKKGGIALVTEMPEKEKPASGGMDY
jgi:co-chaperonin GroES (HSP10)